MLIGGDGFRRPATINGMWRLELNRGRPLQDINTNNPAPVQVVENPFRKGRRRIIGEVVEPAPEPSTSKRTHSAAFSAAEDSDEDEDDVPMAQRLRHDDVIFGEEIVRDRAARVAERTGRGVKGLARGTTRGRVAKDEDVVPVAQGLRHDEVILGEEIIRERPARVAERAPRAERGPNFKYVRGRAGGEEGPWRGGESGRGGSDGLWDLFEGGEEGEVGMEIPGRSGVLGINVGI